MRGRSERYYRYHYNCYHPGNMQARYLVQQTKSGHHISADQGVGPPDLAQVLRNLDLVGFVGVADFYRASVCLLALSLPAESGFRTGAHVRGCRCGANGTAPIASAPGELVHHVVHHNATKVDLAGELSEDMQVKVDRLSVVDRQLYVRR